MAALSRPASRSGRFIKADGRFIKAASQWQASSPFYQREAAKWAGLLDLSHGVPTPYDPTQRPNGRFIKASSDGRFIKASPNDHFIKGRRMVSLSRPVGKF